MKTEEFDFYSKTSLKSYNLNDKMRYQLAMLDGLDAYTRRHCENVANITCRLCEYLHLSEGFTVYTTICAYLHDLGKIFIPPSILQKPSKLTDEEYKIMKTHTTIGYKMCMEDPQLRPYAAGALYHHEALNGTGYPNGIKGNKIPYEAQIIRVADEFEAITAKRQYKTHIGIIDALNIVIENSNPPESKLQTGLKIMKSEIRVGKIDKKIVRALLKVVTDDIEYEISCRIDYLKSLKEDIKRFNDAKKYYDKMEKASSAEKINYYKESVKAYLVGHEEVEKLPILIEETKQAYLVRKKHIDTLFDELKKVKKLKV